MATSTTSSLNPELVPVADREIGKGHGTDALGPSDTSDSGSDVHGGIGLSHEIVLPLDTGTAGPDVGDANLDSDSDAEGTGERATAGRDTVIKDGRDIDADRIERLGQVPDLHTRR